MFSIFIKIYETCTRLLLFFLCFRVSLRSVICCSGGYSICPFSISYQSFLPPSGFFPRDYQSAQTRNIRRWIFMLDDVHRKYGRATGHDKKCARSAHPIPTVYQHLPTLRSRTAGCTVRISFRGQTMLGSVSRRRDEDGRRQRFDTPKFHVSGSITR